MVKEHMVQEIWQCVCVVLWKLEKLMVAEGKDQGDQDLQEWALDLLDLLPVALNLLTTAKECHQKHAINRVPVERESLLLDRKCYDKAVEAFLEAERLSQYEQLPCKHVTKSEVAA